MSEVESLLGTNVAGLKSYENVSLVRSWIQQQPQSELDRLSVGLTGGLRDTTSGNTTAAPDSTSGTDTAVTVAPTADTDTSSATDSSATATATTAAPDTGNNTNTNPTSATDSSATAAATAVATSSNSDAATTTATGATTGQYIVKRIWKTILCFFLIPLLMKTKPKKSDDRNLDGQIFNHLQIKN